VLPQDCYENAGQRGYMFGNWSAVATLTYVDRCLPNRIGRHGDSWRRAINRHTNPNRVIDIEQMSPHESHHKYHFDVIKHRDVDRLSVVLLRLIR